MRCFWCRGKLIRRLFFLFIATSALYWLSLLLLQRNAQSQSPNDPEPGPKIRHQLDDQPGKPRSLLGAASGKNRNRTDMYLSTDQPKLFSPDGTQAHTVVSIPDRSDSRPDPHLDPSPSQDGPNSLEILRQSLLKKNQNYKVLNERKYPPHASDGLILMVQVHKREGYLKQLLKSLKAARGIEDVLLVISHDYFYDDMNAVVETIDFCKVIQIFYPFSLQLFPDTFPGSSKNDCPRDTSKEMAMKMNCTNAKYPDSYGHYREAKVTAIKHHWWWKINMVFDKLQATANFSGFLIFLEEDHYVAPDFIVMANKLIELKKNKCPDCDFINLGMYNKVKSYQGLSTKASVGVWNAGKNNMGFGMNRQTWNNIKQCAKHFCSYDDYNWDWSLNALGPACLDRQLKVLVMKAPRIVHIGSCGIHHHKSCNNEEQQARLAKEKFDSQSAHLFPSSLFLDPGLNPAPPKKKIKNYGGWGDIRDHNLCLSFLEPLS